MPSSVAIWSLAPSPAHTRLATGCDHGAIADNQLELVCKLDPCKTRLLSLAWGISPSETPLLLQDPNKSQSSSSPAAPNPVCASGPPAPAVVSTG
ncbi:hypothetical protein PtA15_17A278 [Puccinia triticina]|uniref:Anaphase-promoting complex subunit 4 WD40 domain-containing protein n=1 Tax=Puccinia triticina TaxID=208348 RepID=A0ABY7D580_9BASI|nr:uncharacterized protein PtA15_17A278 [Puccinia triticina]WAQ92796.1 hypothetical protein PtA15_17A278 [Puccinia triticina]